MSKTEKMRARMALKFPERAVDLKTAEDIWALNDMVLRKARTRLKRLSVHTPHASPAKSLPPVSAAAANADLLG